MKKLFGMTIAMMLGLSMIGCESTDDLSSTMEEPEMKQEEQIEAEENKETEEVENVEEPVEEVEVFNEEELNYYMTTNLPEEEYNEYFNRIKWTEDGKLREVEFNGCILEATPREGYDTRYEMLMVACDYSETDLNGPYIKVEDIAGTQLGNLVFGKCNVKVKGKIQGYNLEKGYLEITINEIEAR